MDFLTYEVWMLERTYELLAGVIDDATTKNAVLESFLIHARALTDFFQNKKTRSTDIVVGDFLDDWSVDVADWLREERQRIDKEIAHLTTERTTGTPKTKQHDVARIRNELIRYVSGFCSEVDSDMLGERFGMIDNELEFSASFIETHCTTNLG